MGTKDTDFYHPSGAHRAYFANEPTIIEVRAGLATCVFLDNMNAKGRLHFNKHFFKEFKNELNESAFKLIEGVAILVG